MAPAPENLDLLAPGFPAPNFPLLYIQPAAVRLLSPLPSGLTPKAPASFPSPAGILSFCPKGGGRRKTPR